MSLIVTHCSDQGNPTHIRKGELYRLLYVVGHPDSRLCLAFDDAALQWDKIYFKHHKRVFLGGGVLSSFLSRISVVAAQHQRLNKIDAFYHYKVGTK